MAAVVPAITALPFAKSPHLDTRSRIFLPFSTHQQILQLTTPSEAADITSIEPDARGDALSGSPGLQMAEIGGKSPAGQYVISFDPAQCSKKRTGDAYVAHVILRYRK
jgi:hypothetical protein